MSEQTSSPREWDRLVSSFLAEHPVADTPDRALREARFDHGLAFPQFRVGSGGLGLDAAAHSVIEARFLEAGAADWSDRNVIGLGMAAPTIHAHGLDHQQALLRPLFTGEHIWCQLFSEPGAGSDLAGVGARAVRDGDEWIVDGQKVWSTLAHMARWGLLLARTDPSVPKHRGLTYFVLDMTSPGVDVRPLRQITGESEFNEVFLTDVRVPADAVVGSVGGGWSVATTTLMSERASLGDVPAGTRPIDEAVRRYANAASAGMATAAHRDRLLRLWVRNAVADHANRRAQTIGSGYPGPEGSAAKLVMAETNQEIFEFCVDLLGPHGVLIDHYDDIRPDVASVHGGADPRRAFLRTRANSIEGGTSEILRNILGERVLGLPSEPRVDKTIPWEEVPRT